LYFWVTRYPPGGGPPITVLDKYELLPDTIAPMGGVYLAYRVGVAFGFPYPPLVPV